VTAVVGAGEAGPADADADAPVAGAVLGLTAAATLGDAAFAATDGPASPPAVWTIPIVRRAIPPKAARIAAATFFRGVRRFVARGEGNEAPGARPPGGSDGPGGTDGWAGSGMSVRRYPDRDALPSLPSRRRLLPSDWRTMIHFPDVIDPNRPAS
jgi:hypothetical protein